MFTPSLMLLSKSSSTTPTVWSTPPNPRWLVAMSVVSCGPSMPSTPGFEQEETEITEGFLPTLFPLFAPIRVFWARTLVLNWSCQTRKLLSVRGMKSDFGISSLVFVGYTGFWLVFPGRAPTPASRTSASHERARTRPGHEWPAALPGDYMLCA